MGKKKEKKNPIVRLFKILLFWGVVASIFVGVLRMNGIGVDEGKSSVSVNPTIEQKKAPLMVEVQSELTDVGYFKDGMNNRIYTVRIEDPSIVTKEQMIEFAENKFRTQNQMTYVFFYDVNDVPNPTTAKNFDNAFNISGSVEPFAEFSTDFSGNISFSLTSEVYEELDRKLGID